jgi:primosomal protein N' (replication factor Y)
LNCRKCKNTNFRSVVFGIERTAEELGKAFPNAIVKYLDAETKLEIAEGVNQLIIATPGVEPHISYSGIVVLDSHIFLSRPEGNSRIRFLRLLMGLRSLLREKGELVIVGESNNPILQTFLKSDPTSVAELLLSERTETRFNPFARTAQVEGEWSALSDIKEHLPNLAQSWGPVSNEHSNQEKYPASILISVPRLNSDELVQWLRAIVVERSVNRKSAILVRIDPYDL